MNVYLKYIIIWLGFMGLIAVATLLVPKIAAAVGRLRKTTARRLKRAMPCRQRQKNRHREAAKVKSAAAYLIL